MSRGFPRFVLGAPGRTRTANLWFRKPSLCPVEIQALDAIGWTRTIKLGATQHRSMATAVISNSTTMACCSLHTLRRALLLSRARGQPSPMVKPPCAALSLLSSHRSRYAVRRSEVPWPLQPRCSSDPVESQACPCRPTPEGLRIDVVATQATSAPTDRLSAGRLGYYPAKPCAARFQAPQNAKPRRVPRACWLSPAVEWFSRDRLGYAE